MADVVRLSPWSIRRSAGLYGAIVLKLLSRMKKGALTLRLPDGERLTLGEGGGLHADMDIKRYDFFRKCVLQGDIGFGESYVDGDWETNSIPSVISWFLLNADSSPTVSGSRRRWLPVNFLKGLNRLLHRIRNNSRTQSRRNIADHYDLSNEFFRIFLDDTMTYSSAYFASPEMTLEEAQQAKYERICRQLKLRKEDHVLEIGCGWGGFAIHAAKTYGCRITAVTLSQKQFDLAVERVEQAGLADQIQVLLTDYRQLDGQYDKIVSIEMLEAVGHRYLPTYFAQCHRLLKQNGLVALQVITCADHRYDELRTNVDWIQKHIFPGSLLPSLGALHRAINRTGDLNFVDLKQLGLHYARTLSLWRQKFNAHRQQVRELGFSERFLRKWNYYLAYCEAAFRMRHIGVFQLILSRPNNTSA